MEKIPFSPPDITQAEIDEVVDTLRSGWITTGPTSKQFEREIAACTGDRPRGRGDRTGLYVYSHSQPGMSCRRHAGDGGQPAGLL